MKKLVSLLLLTAMAFALCACGTKFEPVSKDSLVAALEQYFDYEEGVDFEVLEDYTLVPSDLQYQNGQRNTYNIECCIQRLAWDEDPDSPFIVYYVFRTQEDAREYFNTWRKYDGWGDWHNVDCRYDIVDIKGIHDINGYYLSDRMCFQICTMGEADTTAARNLLESLGLPVEM